MSGYRYGHVIITIAGSLVNFVRERARARASTSASADRFSRKSQTDEYLDTDFILSINVVRFDGTKMQ